MEYADYHVVYVDNRVSQDLDGKLIQNFSPDHSQNENVGKDSPWDDRIPECLESILGEIEEVRSNLRSLLSVFNGGMSRHYLCLTSPWPAAFPVQQRPFSIQEFVRKLMGNSTYVYLWQYLHGQDSSARVHQYQRSASTSHAGDPD